jgi:hypothetical protein
MPKLWWLPFVAAPLFAQAPVRPGMEFSDFFVHDPFILAHKETKTYYLYNSCRGKVRMSYLGKVEMSY